MKFESHDISVLYQRLREHAKSKQEKTKRKDKIELSELVLNISEGCNLCCPYCFANKGLYSGSKPQWMTPKTAYRAVMTLCGSHKEIERIKLFGGEPFMNIPAIEAVASSINKLKETDPERNILVGCVTNMTIYNSSIVDLIKRLHLRITVSIDGPKYIHDENRRFKNGRGSYDRILKNISKYRESDILPVAIECVYTREHLHAGLTMLGLYKFIHELTGTENVIITPGMGLYGTNEKAEEKEFASIVRTGARELYRYCMNRIDSDQAAWNQVGSLMTYLLDPTVSYGWCGLGENTITIDAKGSVLPCYTLMSEKEQWTLADSVDDYVSNSITNHEIQNRINLANPRTLASCESCDIREVCFGCPGGEFSTTGEFSALSRISCAYNMGCVEGLLEGVLNRAERDSATSF